MARAPLQVIVIPYRRRGDGFEYAVLHRADAAMWQFVAGGAEDDETPLDAAKRESAEEAGIPPDRPWMALDARASVPRIAFPTATHWPTDLLVVPELAFAVDVTGYELRLSPEHDESRWLSYGKAARLLTWDSNRVALWELRQRLERGS